MTSTTGASEVLVSAGSKHGATAEIAEHIATTLRRRGIEVTVARPAEVTGLERYRSIILGSAVYAGHWLDDAKDLAKEVAGLEPLPSVWLFSSGPIGDPPKPDEEPVDVADIAQATEARGHQVFAGALDRSKLGLGEKAIVIALRAPHGDFRNWDEISGWADGIADTLTRPDRAGRY